ncbi:ATP-binding protein [Pseudanabaena sp. UWO311]|uniref:AAA family ATPase n=1 Tax=Pseudanabaena sp. UWO311 TaxID=2487337 RepID=UPI0011592726|nr:AAA family ATPase [Pseudanabaena sp. UWO311]TYQ29124.1 ATP-binding protein [Pseudanabaena sp. UWO311]
MKQKLTIHQFGPISDLEIDIDDILVFIGSQASGKSTVSKAIFFFKSLRDDLYRYYLDCYNQNKFDNSISNFAKLARQKFIKIYGSTLQSPNMRLEYRYRDEVETYIYLSQDNHSITIEFSEDLIKTFKKIMDKAHSLYSELHPKSSSFYSSIEISAIKSKESALLKEIENELNWLFCDDRDIVFLPAGRSLITTLSQQRYNIDMGNEKISNADSDVNSLPKLDYLMQNFISRIDQIKPIFEEGLNNLIGDCFDSFNNPETIKTIIIARDIVNSVLRGSYTSINGIEKIAFADDKSTLINFASSGQQEVVWILLIIFLFILNQRKVFLVIEEPEAHLFPIAQKQIIDLIAIIVNQENNLDYQRDNQVVLTTHSPYILSSFNNLLYAHTLSYKLKKGDKVLDIIDHRFWINPDRLNSYILENGTARTIVDREMGLIQSAEIDRASNIIVDTFNQLFDLED